MSIHWKNGIARVLGPNNSQGTGFVVSNEGLIVTCAHVLGFPPPKQVTLVFYTTRVQVEAQVLVDWYRSEQEADVAFLKVEQLPETVCPLPLGSSTLSYHHPLSSFGYPRDNVVDGFLASGMILEDGPTTKEGHLLLQLHSNEITRGFSGAPIWDAGRQRVVGMIVLSRKADSDGKLGKTAFAIPAETLQTICPLLQPDDVCPYKGLAPFSEADASDFFGRELYCEDLLDILQRDRRLLAILGPSGSGKTSVVQAGLIPRLRRGEIKRSDRWEILLVHPTATPFEQFMLHGLLSQGQNLIEGMQVWRKQHPEREHFVLVLDQVEDILTQAENASLKQFTSELVKLIESNLVTVIIVMCDTFYSHLAQHSQLMSLIERQLSNIPPMTKDNLLDVIQKPAKSHGLLLEKGLAETITQDTINTSADLATARRKRHSSVMPLLGVTLLEMWKKRQDNELTFEAFHKLGGIAGSLSFLADSAYFALDETQQALARRLLTNLVFLGDESEGRYDARRQRTLTELSRHESNKALVHEVVHSLSRAHLLETSRDEETQEITVTIIHDILLREWEPLHDWLRQDHRFLSWHYDIEKQARLWVNSNPENPQQRDAGLLLRGQVLHEAKAWLTTHQHPLAPHEHDFITRSIHEHAQEEMRKRQYEDAQRQHRIAVARQLAAQALLLQDHQPHQIDCSLLLAVEAMRRFPCAEADHALRRGLALLPSFVVHIERRRTFRSVTFSPDGQDIAGAGDEKAIWMRSLLHFSQHLHRLPAGLPYDVAFNVDGSSLLIASKNGTAWVLDTRDDAPLALPHPASVGIGVWSPHNPRVVATACDDQRVRIWQVPSGQLLHDVAHDGAIHALSFSHDGTFLATASADHTARLWEMTTGKQLALFPHTGSVYAVAVSPDDALIATAGESGEVILWQRELARKGRKRYPVARFTISHTKSVRAVAFSPDGRLLVTASDDATALVWNIYQQQEVARLKHDGPVKTIRFHPNGTMIATTSDDQTARLWQIPSGKLLSYLPHRGPVQAVAFHPHKPYVATTSEHDGIHIWQMDQGSDIISMQHNGTVKDMRCRVHEKRYRIQMVIEEQTAIQMWEMTEHRLQQTAQYEDQGIARFNVAFNGNHLALHENSAIVLSADGAYVVAASKRGTVDVVETATRQQCASLSYRSPVRCLALSPNGRTIALADQEQHVVVWTWQEGDTTALVTIPEWGEVYALTFSANNSVLVVVTEDHLAHLWQWKANNKEQHFSLHHSGHIHILACSPHGEYVLTVSAENGARVWSLSTGLLITALSHTEAVLAARFSPRGTAILTGSRDGTAGIWETTTGQRLASIEHEHEVYAVAWSEDERYVVTACRDQHVRLWMWQPEDMIARTAPRLTRNLTHEEWHHYIGNEPYQRTYTNLGWREREPEEIE